MDREGIAELLYEHDLVQDYTTCGWVQRDGEWITLSTVYNEYLEQYRQGILSVNMLLANVFEEIACV
jgi:hypothetical protein